MKINYILRLFNLIFSGALVLGLSIWGWDCWATYERSDRTVRVTELSSQMFIAMSNLRIDRLGTAREFSDQGHPIGKTLANARAAELPALAAVIEILQGIDLPDRTKYIDGLTASLKRLKELHAETASAIIRPKSEVRPNLIAESEEQCKSILDSLVQLSSASERLIKLDNAMVDQMLDLYKLAWDTRNMAGDVGALISKSFVGAPLVPDAKAKQMFAFAQIDTYWRILTEKSSYLHLPQRFYDSIADVNKLYFDGPYRPLQMQVLGELTAGQKPSVSVEKWNETAAAALAPMVTTASTALDIANEQASQTRNAMFLQLIVALCSLAAAAVFTLVANVYVTRRVTKPITAMTTAMTRLAAGDADQDLPGVGRSDEIGGMGAAVNVFRENLIRNRELEQENIQSRVDEEQKRKVMLYDLAAKFEASVGGIVRAVANSAGDLEQAATVMSRTALDTSKRSTVVAAASEEAATNVTVVASAAEELGSSVTEIGRQVTRSASIAQGAADEARSTAEIVAELSTSAANISEVLGLISTIAAQTNLLALNATIEAARAGEAGRGFAVVAAEVKELANQTAKATADISGQIGAIQSATERAVVAIGGIGETIEQINRDATAITDAVTEQGKATSEIVGSIAQASRGTSEVTDNIASVASAATECGTAADQVLSASRHLKGQSEQLRSEVDRFLGTVRAA